VPCRAALAQYKRDRRLHPTGTVDASSARAHLAQLQARGIGARQLGKLAGISSRHVARVLAGRVARLRPATAARLLSVRPVLARGASVAGTRTHRFLDSLRREGFTHRSIAFRLGAHSHQLQLSRRVRVSSALKVAAVYALLAGDGPDLEVRPAP
jgi:hypothetical protein